jgi:hypothetical protein
MLSCYCILIECAILCIVQVTPQAKCGILCIMQVTTQAE